MASARRSEQQAAQALGGIGVDMVVVLRFLDQPYLVAGKLRMFAGIGYERRKRRSSIIWRRGKHAETNRITPIMCQAEKNQCRRTGPTLHRSAPMTRLSLSKTMIGRASARTGANPGSPVVANPTHRCIISADRFSTAASFAPAMMGAFIQARQVPSANRISRVWHAPRAAEGDCQSNR